MPLHTHTKKKAAEIRAKMRAKKAAKAEKGKK